LTLALFSHLLASPQADWPPNVTVTGSVFYNGPTRCRRDLEAFLDSGLPPVVFTLGSSLLPPPAGSMKKASMRPGAGC
jgi:hypothetical protein